MQTVMCVTLQHSVVHHVCCLCTRREPRPHCTVVDGITCKLAVMCQVVK
jgi:hypothetical protein